MRALRLAMGAGLVVATMTAWAEGPGTGITGSAHDWSARTRTVLLWNTGKTDATTGAPITSTDNRYGTPYIDLTTGKQGTTTLTVGQCTTCHTPHQAKTQQLLWNHTLTTTQYRWDDPKTTAGTDFATFKGDTYKGPTTKCLSCHDGQLASTDGMWFGRQMVTGTKYVPSGSTPDSGKNVAAGANMTKNHPVAMPYPLNGTQNAYNGVTSSALLQAGEWVANPMTTNSIRLFNDNGTGQVTAGAVAGKTGIECTSCHDVHNGPRVKDHYLVTGLISGSDRSPGGYICTQCHQK